MVELLSVEDDNGLFYHGGGENSITAMESDIFEWYVGIVWDENLISSFLTTFYRSAVPAKLGQALAFRDSRTFLLCAVVMHCRK